MVMNSFYAELMECMHGKEGSTIEELTELHSKTSQPSRIRKAIDALVIAGVVKLQSEEEVRARYRAIYTSPRYSLTFSKHGDNVK